MDRRTFLAGTGAMLLAAPLAAEGQQQGKVYRVGLVFTTAPVSEMVGPDPVHPLVRSFLMNCGRADTFKGGTWHLSHGLPRGDSNALGRSWRGWSV